MDVQSPDTQPAVEPTPVGEGAPTPVDVAPTTPDAAPEPVAAEPAPPTPQPREQNGTFASPAEIPLAEILARPDVKAELNKQAKLAAKSAMEEAQEAARVAAERAKMDEVERLKLEKSEAEARATQNEAKAVAAERERDLANTLIAGNTKLASPKSLDFLRFNAFQLCDGDSTLTMADAVNRVLAEHGYLVAGVESNTPAEAPVVAPPVERPSTAPPTKTTQAPAAAKPDEGVDVMSMTKQEYLAYKRSTHPSIH